MISRLEVPSSMVSRMTECGWESRWVGRNERRIARSLVGGVNWVNRHVRKVGERVPSLVMSKVAMLLGMIMMLSVMMMLTVINSSQCHWLTMYCLSP